jgi:hypothetical protein
MKKHFALFFLYTLLSVAVFAQNASDFETDGRGTITKFNGWDTDIAIPAEIGGITITAIANGVLITRR